MTAFSDLVKSLMWERYGPRGARALARATTEAPEGAGMSHTTVRRIIAGEFAPNDDRIRALAWALADSKSERAKILAQLRTAAGRVAEDPPPLLWPPEVKKLSNAQRRSLQRVVNAAVAGMTDDEELLVRYGGSAPAGPVRSIPDPQTDGVRSGRTRGER